MQVFTMFIIYIYKLRYIHTCTVYKGCFVLLSCSIVVLGWKADKLGTIYKVHAWRQRTTNKCPCTCITWTAVQAVELLHIYRSLVNILCIHIVTSSN